MTRISLLQERQWRVKYAFDHYTYWNLETPPTANNNFLAWRGAVALANKVRIEVVFFCSYVVNVLPFCLAPSFSSLFCALCAHIYVFFLPCFYSRTLLFPIPSSFPSYTQTHTRASYATRSSPTLLHKLCPRILALTTTDASYTITYLHSRSHTQAIPPRSHPHYSTSLLKYTIT